MWINHHVPVLHVRQIRKLSNSRSTMLSASDISAAGSATTKQKVIEAAISLVEQNKWSLWLEGAGLQRSFKFKTFKAAWSFMDEVASECEACNHHPEWTNVFNRTQICWTTHRPRGLSLKDIRMAHFCDEAAQRHGEEVPEPVTPDKVE